MPNEQGFSLIVPNTNSTITAGAGAAEGICLTSDANHFLHAGAEIIVESVSDMRFATTGAFGAAATAGVLIGTPATIQASAGGGVQIYAGAGITPSIGSPNGPGAGFGASGAPKTGAGERAKAMNRFNDAVKGASDVAGAVMSFQGATDAIGQAGAVLSGAKGAWDATKAVTGASSSEADMIFGVAGIGMGAVGAGNSLLSGDNVGATTGAIGFVTGLATLAAGEQQKSNAAGVQAAYGEALAEAEAARAARTDAGGAGGSLGPPADGPRIHEVAPANIDRECGGDMTALVGGDKKSTVDGSVSYVAGNSISMKAFSAVSTSSLTFSAHANVSASMKGLATAKVESFGAATLDGKAKFTVSSKGSGTVSAPKLAIKGTGTLTLTSPSATIDGGNLTIDSLTTVKKQVIMQKNVRIGMKLQVGEGAEIKKKLDVDGPIKASGKIHARQEFKNPYFKAG